MIKLFSFFSICIFYVCTTAFLAIPNFPLKNSTVVISNDSFLKIKGKTNVNSFECEFDMQKLSDSISINYQDLDGLLKFDKAKLILPNLQFDCGGRGINKDFNKLLNTEEFPEIQIRLKEIEQLDIQDNSVQATVDIIICDIVKTYTLPIQINRTNNLAIEGVLPLNINDFNLEEPRKVLGIIKVSPIIEIEFSLNITHS